MAMKKSHHSLNGSAASVAHSNLNGSVASAAHSNLNGSVASVAHSNLNGSVASVARMIACSVTRDLVSDRPQVLESSLAWYKILRIYRAVNLPDR